MTREEARQALLEGKYLTYHAWTWGQFHRSCHSEENCCYWESKNIDETLDDVIDAVQSWDRVEVIE